MGAGQKFGGRNRGKHGKGKEGGKRRERTNKDYQEIVMNNVHFEEYYSKNGCVPKDELVEFFDALRKPLPLSFRVTGSTSQAKELIAQMETTHLSNIESLVLDNGKVVKPAEPLPWYPNRLAWKTNLSRQELRKFPQLSGFHQWMIAEGESGHVTRQELVSMIPTLLLDIKSHCAVLDMCAAPGSKTSQIIEALHADAKDGSLPEGFCVANDANNRRCYMLVHQAKRLNSPCCMVVNHDAQGMPNMKVKKDSGEGFEWLQYDRILADVPCSGDGTMRKNPDVWTSWRPNNTLNLHAMQFRIAQRGLELLKVGGKMVYSTCSMSPIEDEAVVSALIKKCEGSIRLVSIDGMLPGLKYEKGVSTWPVYFDGKFHTEPNEESKKHHIIKDTMFPPEGAKDMNMDRCIRLLPHHGDTGGFFVAVLEKTAPLPWQNDQKDCPDPTKEKKDGEPPRKKPKTWRKGTFNEDPFVFMKSTDTELEHVKEFYNLSDDFAMTQVFNRLREDKKETSKCRNIFFVVKKLSEILKYNIDSIKFINSGVRIFARTEGKMQDALYRVTQDGIDIMRFFCRTQTTTIDHVEDMKVLLREENPEFNLYSEAVKAQIWKDTKNGPFIMNYSPTKGAGFSVCGWRGDKSLRLYINKHDRIHFLHLMGESLPDWLKLQKNTRATRHEAAKEREESGNVKEAEAENKDEEVNGKTE